MWLKTSILRSLITDWPKELVKNVWKYWTKVWNNNKAIISKTICNKPLASLKKIYLSKVICIKNGLIGAIAAIDKVNKTDQKNLDL